MLTAQLGGAGVTEVSAVVAAPASADVEESRVERLKQVFKRKFTLFRDGVYLLTGFKVDMSESNGVSTFHLRSVYAEKEEVRTDS